MKKRIDKLKEQYKKDFGKRCRICGKRLNKYQEDVCSWKCNDTWEQEKVVKEGVYDTN